jgi:hypothetical protein
VLACEASKLAVLRSSTKPKRTAQMGQVTSAAYEPRGPSSLVQKSSTNE